MPRSRLPVRRPAPLPAASSETHLGRRSDPAALAQLVLRRGLEDCGALIAAATPAQLTALLDLDLWRAPLPGHDDQLDIDRFGLLMEVLADLSPSVAAATLVNAELDLVVAGLTRYIRVFDPGIFEPTAQSDDEPGCWREAMREGDVIDAATSSAPSLECEIEGYVVRARRGEAWDAIVAVLAALGAEHPESFHVVMRECRRLSNSRPEVDGLDDLLPTAAQHLHEVSSARESRRDARGYVSPADARAFLEQARTRPYATSVVVTPASSMAVALHARDGVPLSTWLAHLSDVDDVAHATRTSELAYLANVLLSGCALHDRAFTPAEAARAAASTCALGLECSLAVPASDDVLRHHDLVRAFEVGWSVLHHDVGLDVAHRLVATLNDLPCRDETVADDLGRLRHALDRHARDGRPWRARAAAEALAALDVAAWFGVTGLLGECPVVAAVLDAVVEGRTTGVSATDFAFIASRQQIAGVRRFMQSLPDVLAGAMRS